jgi:hypothetical protein
VAGGGATAKVRQLALRGCLAALPEVAPSNQRMKLSARGGRLKRND